MNDPLSDQMDFSGRVALVSGGTSGIGRAVVRQQGELGAKLAVADRNHEGAKDVVAELGADNAMAIAVDVADPDSDHRVLWVLPAGSGNHHRNGNQPNHTITINSNQIGLLNTMRILLSSVAIVCCVSGSAYAQDFQKGLVAYKTGDYVTAHQEWRALAEQGKAAAQLHIGDMYRHGQGVPQDYEKASSWYRKAAEQGNADAQYNLGERHYEGLGAVQSFREAAIWYRKAAEQGHADAQTGLAYMYKHGEGIPEDEKEAVHWYRKAAAQGNAYAQGSLGIMYADGHGVAQNNVLAYMWFGIAFENGWRTGGFLRTSISRKMSQEAIKKAKAMVRGCMSGGYTNCGN